MTIPSAQKQAEAEARRLREQLLALQHAHRLQYECSEKWRTEAEELRAKLAKQSAAPQPSGRIQNELVAIRARLRQQIAEQPGGYVQTTAYAARLLLDEIDRLDRKQQRGG